MRKFKIIVIMLTAVLAMSSCIKSDESETTLYGDAYITAFSLGTLNRYLHTTSAAGTDSIYKVAVTGSSYKFKIDQVNRLIYNTDSLPVGTDVAHVICNISTRNNGLAVIKDVSSDTLRYYSSSDSIDFTQPRDIRVYASDGSGYNTYTIHVNVHQEEGNKFVWQQTDNNWTPDVTPQNLPQGIKQRIGSSSTEQYALSDDNRLMVSKDNGETWQEETLDDDAALLPTQDIAIVSYPMNMNDSTDYVVMVGNRNPNDYPQETTAMVWRKIVDYSKNAPAARWTYMERSDNSLLTLPRLQNLTIAKYDDGILALGGAGIGGCTLGAYTQIYQSRDNGITWKYNSRYQLPEGFDKSAASVQMTTDEDNFLWLHCSGTGQVWRGRLNRLGWGK